MASAQRKRQQKEGPERLCSRTASRQFGVLSLEQALGAGMSQAAISRKVASGEWRRVFKGVYAVALFPKAWEQSLMATLLWAGPEAAISHRSAAACLGLDGVKPGYIEVTLPRSRRASAPYVITHCSPISRIDFGRFGPLRITTPSRTLIDLGAVVDEESLEIALDCALRKNLTSEDRLRAHLARLGGRGRRGAGVLSKLLEARGQDARACHSPLETRFRRLCRRFRLPLPQAQFPIVLAGRRRRLDFAYPGVRLGIELDGRGEHSNRPVFEDDRRRQNLLVLEGWTILRFTHAQIVEEPEAVAAQARAALVRLGHVSLT